MILTFWYIWWLQRDQIFTVQLQLYELIIEVSENFDKLRIENRIKHEKSSPYFPHQNDTVERSWRTLFSTASCLLIESKLPPNLWDYALHTSAYIIRVIIKIRKYSIWKFHRFEI